MIILLKLEAVSKSIAGKVLFQNISFSCDVGEMVFIVGESGCGKTTLLNMLAGYDQDYQGKIYFQGLDLKAKNRQNRIKTSSKIGMIFQHLYLIPYYRNIDNICLFKSFNQPDLDKIIHDLHIEKIIHSMPNKTSGGEQQRVAIARVLIHQPWIILADEPTGSLDEENSKIVFDLLQNQSKKSPVIVVTHNRIMAEKYATTILDLASGCLYPKQEALEHTNELVEDSAPLDILKFIIHQFQHFWKHRRHFLLPSLIAVLTYIFILGGLSIYQRFYQNLLYQQSLRIDKDYLTLYLSQEGEDNASIYAEIQKQGGIEIEPYQAFLNQGLTTYLYYYQNNPFFKNFYFEIVPINELEKDVAINRLFYDKCDHKIEQIFLRFQNQETVSNDLFNITQIVDDGEMFNTPRLFINYEYCLSKWPTIPFVDNRRYFHFPEGSQNIKQYLFNQDEYKAYYAGLIGGDNGVRYDYSGYLLDNMLHDLSSNGVMALLAIVGIILITIASLQSLIFAYLARRRYREAILLRSHGASSYIFNYVLVHDLMGTNVFSFGVAISLYLISTMILPSYLVFSFLACIVGIAALLMNLMLTSMLMLYKINHGMMSSLIQENQIC